VMSVLIRLKRANARSEGAYFGVEDGHAFDWWE